MRRFIKCGLFGVSVFCFLAGSGWAQESGPLETTFVGTAYSVYEWDPSQPAVSQPPGDIVITYRYAVSEWTDNIFGSSTCYFSGSFPYQYLGPLDEPPVADVEGVCDPALGIWGYAYEGSPSSECRLKETGAHFTSSYASDRTTCRWCSDPDCLSWGYTDFFTVTWTSEDGAAFSSETQTVEEGSAIVTMDVVQTRLQSWDYTLHGDRMEEHGISEQTTGKAMVTFNVPPAELPSNEVSIEVPSEGSTMSGIGVISGWSCLGGELVAELRTAAGEVITPIPLAYGTERTDTESTCGDTPNGFSSTVNWNIPGLREAKTIHLMQNGEEVASNTFSVVALAEEFLTGMWTTTVQDFPTAGRSATMEWDASQQGFVISELN